VHCVVGVGVDDGVLGKSLWWWSDYVACNLEQPNKICKKNIKKNIRGSTMSTRVTPRRCAHPQGEGLTLWRETLRQERGPKLETRKERRAQ
jgi:hypothetical protein